MTKGDKNFIMDLGATKTNVATFETDVTLVRKIKNSLGVIQDNKLLLFAPFSLNRAFTGIHYTIFKHDCKIMDVTFILANDMFSENPYYENSIGYPTSTMILFYDAALNFYILDATKQIIQCQFKISDNDRVISFCGSSVKPNEFIVLTPTDICIYNVDSEIADQIFSTPFRARRIIPFGPYYTLLSNDEVTVFDGVNLKKYFQGDEIESFVISDDDIIISRNDPSHGTTQSSIFEKISNGTVKSAIGLKKVYDNLWDAANGWIVTMVRTGSLAIGNINYPKARALIKTETQIELPKWLFAGIIKHDNALGVVVIGSNKLETYQVPLDSLNKLIE